MPRPRAASAEPASGNTPKPPGAATAGRSTPACRMHGKAGAASRCRRWWTAAMLTHWFTDVPVAGHDRDLVRALSLAVRWIDDEEPPCHIGLLGDDGRLYRIVIAHREPQRTAVEATLRSFGYAPRRPLGRSAGAFTSCSSRRRAWPRCRPRPPIPVPASPPNPIRNPSGATERGPRRPRSPIVAGSAKRCGATRRPRADKSSAGCGRLCVTGG
jgi:hypothetical protein